MNISKRLKVIADFVTNGNRLADVGTDHGYVPIYLARKGLIPSAIALDINEGPLRHAKQNIELHKLEDRISTRLSDGLDSLNDNEADTVLIAGMGGALEVRIMTAGFTKLKNVKELILSPQSEIDLVRHFLNDNGFSIVQEDMLEDEGKFYTVMKAEHGHMNYDKEIFYKYGKYLLENENEVLRKFLLKERNTYNSIIEKLETLCFSQEEDEGCNRGEQVMERIKNLKVLQCEIEEGLTYYE